MRAPLSISQIETIVKKHYPGAEQLMPLSGGLVSQTYSFRLGSAKLVFKIGDWADAYEKESYVGQVYGNLLPLRAVKGVFTNEYGVSYCFSSYLSGLKLFDLTNNELAILVPEVVRALELIAKVSVPSDAGYGVFDANGKAEFSSWVV